MEHDILLTRKDGSARRFRIYGSGRPNLGDIVTLPIDGRMIKARVGKADAIPSSAPDKVETVNELDAAEI
jgi:hypothetical protein